jgi:hypothetical protein
MINYLKETLKVYENDPAIQAIILLGSVSAGANDETSDADICIVYSGSKPELSMPEAPWKWDVWYMTSDELAGLSRENHWGLNAFLTAKILFDKTGEIPGIIDKLIHLSSDDAKNKASYWLDAYLNGFYRSMKANRRRNELGALLEGAMSIKYLVACIYSLNNLIPPYEDRIQETISSLEKLPLPLEDLLSCFKNIIKTADPVKQAYLFRANESLFRKHGFSSVFDAWEGKLDQEVNRAVGNDKDHICL